MTHPSDNDGLRSMSIRDCPTS